MQGQKELHQLHKALQFESEAKKLVDDGGALLVDVMDSRVLRDLLHHYLEEAQPDENWEPSLSALLDPSKSGVTDSRVTADDPPSCSTPCSSPGGEGMR